MRTRSLLFSISGTGDFRKADAIQDCALINAFAGLSGPWRDRGRSCRDGLMRSCAHDSTKECWVEHAFRCEANRNSELRFGMHAFRLLKNSFGRLCRRLKPAQENKNKRFIGTAKAVP